MAIRSRLARLRAVAVLLAASLPVAQAAVVLDETRVLTSGPAAVSRALEVTQAATLDIDVTDLAFPAALSQLRVAVTRGDTLVRSATATGRLTLDATPGSYVIRVLGRPAAAGSGSVGISVTRAADAAPRTALLEFVASFRLPGSAAGTTTIDENFTVGATGNHTVLLVDHGFPAATTSLTAAVFACTPGAGCGTPVRVGLGAGTTALSNLAAGQYNIKVVAQAAAAGLVGVRVAPAAGGASLLDASYAIGALEPSLDLPAVAGAPLSLTLTDFAFPSALAQLGGAVTRGADLVLTQAGPGIAQASSPGAGVQLWRRAVAGAAPGSYALALASGSTVLYSEALGISSSTAGAPGGYSFPLTLPSAGSFRARVTDFQFPSGLAALQFVVVQDGAIVGRATTGGSVDFTGVAGPATVLVIAQAPPGGAGLFGVEVLGTAAGAAAFYERTQAAGAPFEMRPVSISTAGRYDVVLTDVQWPARFDTLALALTRGGQVVGRIFNGGTFFVDATPGEYLASFIATPASAEGAGLYALRVQSSVPTVALTASAATVTAGSTVRLDWTSTAATSCTASSGWTGTKVTSGNETSASLSANTTFVLACTGPGGTTSASVSVAVTPAPPPPGGGGGGAMGWLGLAALGGLAALRPRRSAMARRA